MTVPAVTQDGQTAEMAVIGFASHSGRHNAVELAKSTAVWLEEKGHEAVLLPELGLLRETGSDALGKTSIC